MRFPIFLLCLAAVTVLLAPWSRPLIAEGQLTHFCAGPRVELYLQESRHSRQLKEGQMVRLEFPGASMVQTVVGTPTVGTFSGRISKARPLGSAWYVLVVPDDRPGALAWPVEQLRQGDRVRIAIYLRSQVVARRV